MIVHIRGSSSQGCVILQRRLHRCVSRSVSVQYPLAIREPEYLIQLDSCTNPPFPFVVVTATRRGTSHTFCVFGEFWAEQATNVLLTLFPELERPTKRFFNPVLHPERYAAHLRRKHGR